MGCGRSGTWLLYSLLTRVMDSYALFEEVDVARFARIKSDKLNHLLKRYYKSYWTAHLIPRSVGIVWIVRHPFDVLTSHHPVRNSHRAFHVGSNRWNGEMDALKTFIGEARPNGIVLRYEDLVSDPDGTLQRIVEAFGQEMSASARDLVTSKDIPAEIRETMQGLRPVSKELVGRWRSHPDFVARLHDVLPSIHERLRWVSDRFGYDTTLT